MKIQLGDGPSINLEGANRVEITQQPDGTYKLKAFRDPPAAQAQPPAPFTHTPSIPVPAPGTPYEFDHVPPPGRHWWTSPYTYPNSSGGTGNVTYTATLTSNGHFSSHPVSTVVQH